MRTRTAALYKTPICKQMREQCPSVPQLYCPKARVLSSAHTPMNVNGISTACRSLKACLHVFTCVLRCIQTDFGEKCNERWRQHMRERHNGLETIAQYTLDYLHECTGM